MLKRKRFPISFQFDTMDCGPSCLEMIARYHGGEKSQNSSSGACAGRIVRGHRLAGIARAAETLGFRTLAVKVSFDDLKQKAPLPCIAFWPHGHFVVIHRIRGNVVYLADPAAGLTTYTRGEFETCWLDPDQQNWGVILLLEPTKQRLTVESKPTFTAFSDILWSLWRDVRRHALAIGYRCSGGAPGPTYSSVSERRGRRRRRAEPRPQFGVRHSARTTRAGVQPNERQHVAGMHAVVHRRTDRHAAGIAVPHEVDASPIFVL